TGAARSPRRLAAAVGARGAARDESRRRGLGPPCRAGGGVDALLGSDRAGPRAMSAFVTLDGVRKQWSHTVAVGPLSLEIPRGEILVLLGPSGSGKTTVLRLLGGFEAPDAGRIVLAGEDVTAVPPARRRCGMVFQHYALFPHLDAGDNVAFGLMGRRTRWTSPRRACSSRRSWAGRTCSGERRPRSSGQAPVRCSWCGPSGSRWRMPACRASCGSGGTRAPPPSTWSRRSRAIGSRF